MNRVTASGSGRLLQCSGHVRMPWLRETSDAASEGTRLHAILDRNCYPHHEAFEAAVDATAETREAWRVWTEWRRTMGLRMTYYFHEQAFVLDTESRSARTLDTAGHREYGPTKWHEIPGTADFIARCENADGQTVLVIVDWKFGHEPQATDSAQLRTLGAMAASALCDSAEEYWTLIVQVPQGTESGSVSAKRWTWDDLLAHVEVLGDALNDAHEGRIMLQRGSECRYCPAAHACPSQLAAMSAIVSPGGPGPITPERAGQIWAELRQAKKRLDAIEEECKALAEASGGLPLPGGKRLVLVQRNRASMDAKQLEAIARGHGASDGEIETCRKVTTYTTTQEIKA